MSQVYKPQMQLTICASDTLTSLIRKASNPPSTVRWESPAAFLRNAQAKEGRNDDTLRIWLYRAPWESVAGTPFITLTLHQWKLEQRAALALQAQHKERCILVDVDRVRLDALFKHLRTPPFATLETAVPSPSSTALAWLFEQAAPEYWRLYKELEAASWSDTEEPCYSAAPVLPLGEGFCLLLDLIGRGHSPSSSLIPPRSEASMANSERIGLAPIGSLCERKNEIEHHRSLETASPEKEKAHFPLDPYSLRGWPSEGIRATKDGMKELELVTAQLYEVQQELEKDFLDNRSYREELDNQSSLLGQLNDELSLAREAQMSSESARDDAMLRASRLHEEVARKDLELSALAEKNMLLSIQLQQTQAELEKYFLADQEISATIRDYETTFHRARLMISRLMTNG